VNEKFTEDIDPQHAGMTALALASALNRLELVKVSFTWYCLTCVLRLPVLCYCNRYFVSCSCI